VGALSETLATLAAESDHWRATPGEHWRQGQTLYGGLSAAFAVKAAGLAFAGLPMLRSAQFAFVGPAVGALDYRPTMVRQGKSSAFVSVTAEGEAGPATQALLCYGRDRESAYRYNDVPMPDVRGHDAGEKFFNIGGVPGFTVNFEGVLVEGSPPGSGVDRPFLRVWVRHRDPDSPDGPISLVALGDALPPGALSMFKSFSPISTMTWSIELPTGDDLPGSDWYLFETRGETIGNGYSVQDMKLWHESGRLALVGRQTVAVYG
jgi:acyl-CoA thioesterase